MSAPTDNQQPDPVELAAALLSRLTPPVGVVRALVRRLGLDEGAARLAVEEARREHLEWSGSRRSEKRGALAAFYRSVVQCGLGTTKDQLEAASRLAELEGVVAKTPGVSVNVIAGSAARMNDEERRLALARLRERFGPEVVDGPQVSGVLTHKEAS